MGFSVLCCKGKLGSPSAPIFFHIDIMNFYKVVASLAILVLVASTLAEAFTIHVIIPKKGRRHGHHGGSSSGWGWQPHGGWGWKGGGSHGHHNQGWGWQPHGGWGWKGHEGHGHHKNNHGGGWGWQPKGGWGWKGHEGHGHNNGWGSGYG